MLDMESLIFVYMVSWIYSAPVAAKNLTTGVHFYVLAPAAPQRPAQSIHHLPGTTNVLANSIFPTVGHRILRFRPLRRKVDSGEHRTATSPPF